MRFALLAVLLLLNLPLSTHAQTASPAPFWVEVTQEYKYPGTEWTSSPGMVEQVIAEDAVNYVVTSSDGAQLKLPKAYSKKITGEEAAIKLFAERKQNYDLYMGQLVREDEIIKQAKEKIAEYDTALKASQAKVTEYEQGLLMLAAAMKAQQQNQGGNSMAEAQQALQLMQQLQGMSGKRGSGAGGAISKSDRARMERDVWTAGLTTNLYTARGLSDADLQNLWLQARQILETRAAGQNRR
jgi:hypothetical protein